ncbi:hypothetical protein VY88_04025 [Azospirillum thiophilum]|uniref:DUF1156 domain-containing protein n=1 Tax=Azospirillum thiophilum TaxID=528244 RepID=UPI0005EFC64D|nr:DUF1156 domain-containing protein [Azospirillum thiophilum]KJR65360.1 hypothetical protein VY88_04025 [Azospirillum thiophilum]
MVPAKTKKKLIEVALPLEAINKESAREKSIRHGHPSTLHLWWARRPLAAARAVIFAQMVDDPSEYVETLLRDPALKQAAARELAKRETLWDERTAAMAAAVEADADLSRLTEAGLRPTLEECAADLERERLFDIIRDLVKWENTTNEAVLDKARAEIWQSWRRTCAENADHPRAKELFDRHTLPAFHDPFAGGGALPLEAQRLGLEAHASDLNPVAVLINKAMIEIPPKFAGHPPVNPVSRAKPDLVGRTWKGAEGLAEDVRYYGQWMRDEAEKRIGHLYPKIEITEEMTVERPDLKPLVGQKLTVIAWLWARTVKSPNPAFADVDVPLASTFVLSAKVGKEAYVEPVIEEGKYRFIVKVGKQPETAKDGTKLSRGANFRCVMSDTAISGEYIKTQGQIGRLGTRLMAMVAEGKGGRFYLTPTPEQEEMAHGAMADWNPEVDMPENPRWFSPPFYGMKAYRDLFTSRQFVTLTTFSELVQEVRKRVENDARDNSYADAVATQLSFTVSRLADRCSNICSWDLRDGQGRKSGIRNVFSRQAIPMTWDFAEANPLSEVAASAATAIMRVADTLDRLPTKGIGFASLSDASSQGITVNKVVSTDPPYYDNIGYADLSDFFYIWLRRSLRLIYPDICATLAVPKAEELVATPYRHGGKEKAERFFLDGMTQAMSRLAEQAHPSFPTTIYYAFKQSETKSETGTASTGWETFLDAVIRAGFAISGTWPMRTELSNRMIGSGTNALASSIVLVCRPRHADARIATRREFLTALKTELPAALAHLQQGNIAPVDLAQAAIGPGMAVYTRFAKVVDAEGKMLTVREALALINQELGEVLAQQEGDFDADTRWALVWFDQNGFAEGEYGVAEQLSKAKTTSVAGLVKGGIVALRPGKVRLLRPTELDPAWDPATDNRLSIWEMVHHLIRSLESGGEAAAARVLAALGSKAEVARELAYHLYSLAERKKRAAEALSYNGLVQSWPEIVALSRDILPPPPPPSQPSFL